MLAATTKSSQLDDKKAEKRKGLDAAGLGVAALTSAAVGYTCMFTQVDMDILGKLRFGSDILSTGILIPVDRYSYLHCNHEWIDNEWLSELLFAFAFNSGGWIGLVTIKTVIAAAVMLVIYQSVKKTGMDTNGQAITMIVTTFLLGPSLRVVRPLLFTCLGMALLFAILQKSRKQPACLQWLPPLFALWANLHPGFVAGLVCLLGWVGGELLRFQLRKAGYPLILMRSTLASVIATTVNPYSIALWMLLVTAVTLPRPDIWEWIPISIRDPFGAAYIAVLGLTIFCLVKSERCKDSSVLLVYGLCALTPLLALRHLSLFAIATTMLCGNHFADIWNRRPAAKNVPSKREQLFILVSSLLIALAIAAMGVARVSKAEFVTSLDMPAKVVKLLKLTHAKGNLATDFDWGEYIIYHLGPEVKVSYDGRRESLYSETSTVLNGWFRDGLLTWDLLIDKCGTNLVLVRKDCAAANLMQQKQGWKRAYTDETCVLFCRQDSLLPAQFSEAQKKDANVLKNLDPVFLGKEYP